MPAVIQVQVSSELSIRDPEQTELGRKIVEESILLIDQLGFDGFTFKKLAKKISSTEASVYRYFESKHQLLQYLVSWYWSWLEFVIDYRIQNVDDARQRLKMAIAVLAESDKYDPAISHINEALLHKIVIAESARVFMSRGLKKARKKALFEGYDLLGDKLVEIFKALNPRYKFHGALVITLITSMHRLLFLAEFHHSIKSKSAGSSSKSRNDVLVFSEDLVLKCLGVKK